MKGRIQTASRPGKSGGSAHPVEVSCGVEASPPFEDKGVCLASATTASDDKVQASAHGPGCSSGMPIVCLIEDFRPMSLSNSLYLIFAKALANRLQGVLLSLISPFQSAFIPVRQMVDNIVLAEEIIVAWHRDGTIGFMWKVDFAKAYDSIDWHFLWNVLRRRGFPETWVRWVK